MKRVGVRVKYLVFFLLLVSAVSLDAQERVEKPTLLKPVAPFAVGGEVSMSESRWSDKIEVNKIENGALNGVHYRIYYTDGSGTFSSASDGQLSTEAGGQTNWGVACKKDPMDDSKYCYLQRQGLWVWTYPGGRIKVFIGGDQYPNTSVSVRIDSKPAIKSPSDSEGMFTAAQSKQIVQQMKDGSQVSTRYTDWPYGAATDDSMNLNGFDEAFEYIQWAVKQIK